MSIDRLPPEALYRRCDAARLGFDTTADLQPLAQLFGQPRAAGSVDFGIGIAREGYNLYVMGSPGTGKHTLVKQHLARRVEKRSLASDWAYVNNFREPSKPIALELPAGRGAALREDMRTLVEELRTAIPAVFESDEYRAHAGQIEAEFSERHEKAFTELGSEAAKDSIGLLRTPAGFTFAPLKDGEVMSPEDFAALGDDERARIERRIGELQSKLESIIRNVVRWRKEQRERFKELNREMTLYAVGHHVADLKEKYRDVQRVLEYVRQSRVGPSQVPELTRFSLEIRVFFGLRTPITILKNAF